eukprot:GHRR01016384.1.p1 GENE.GHRR01016384.1~~GHRR01016384.1.p1  ORF type:complete len:559 (+),score=278.57 GHRR01016384.1:995-2671(+)
MGLPFSQPATAELQVLPHSTLSSTSGVETATNHILEAMDELADISKSICCHVAGPAGVQQQQQQALLQEHTIEHLPVEQQQEQQLPDQPQAPPAPCSRPQSHQTSRRTSRVDSSRPGSAAQIMRPGQPGWRPERVADEWMIGLPAGAGIRSRPASAAATAGAAAGARAVRNAATWFVGSGDGQGSSAGVTQWVDSRPSSSRQKRPASAAAGWGGSRDAAADASLQRLKDSCAQQRQELETVSQSMLAANDAQVDSSSTAEPLSPAAVESAAAPLAAHVGSGAVLGRPMSPDASRAGRPASGRVQSYSRPSSSQGTGGAAVMGTQLQQVLEERSTAYLPDMGSTANARSSMQQGRSYASHDSSKQLDDSGLVYEDNDDSPSAPVSRTVCQHRSSTVVASASDLQDSETVASRALSGAEQQQLQAELNKTLQLFQQRLEQTALMAQQLLAQQIAGQAARRSSRPSSATMATISPAGASRSNAAVPVVLGGSRPGSASVPAGLGGGRAKDGGLAAPAGLGDIARNLAALAVDAPPTMEEIVEYARYLGMDPEQVCITCSAS